VEQLVEGLHGDAAIQRVKREAHAEAFEFDQVAALVVVGSPVTLTPVDDDLLDLAVSCPCFCLEAHERVVEASALRKKLVRSHLDNGTKMARLNSAIYTV
jgi:hypothetical protein